MVGYGTGFIDGDKVDGLNEDDPMGEIVIFCIGTV